MSGCLFKAILTGTTVWTVRHLSVCLLPSLTSIERVSFARRSTARLFSYLYLHINRPAFARPALTVCIWRGVWGGFVRVVFAGRSPALAQAHTLACLVSLVPYGRKKAQPKLGKIKPAEAGWVS